MDRRQFVRSSAAFGVALATGGCTSSANRSGATIPAISLDREEIDLPAAAVRELGDSMTGPLMLSGHPQYDAARTIWNGMHDRHPALIARCLDSADVGRAVSFARDNDMLVAIRGGGHSWPGNSVCDGGLMIDLSQINAVNVDAGRRRARAGGGALLGALDAGCLQHGLVTTAGVVSHTGIGGYTLGGGFGRLNRKYGLTVDNVLGATIVTADGRVRTVSADEEADLYWAIRGGGGNFGVVTEFEYQLHPFDPEVLSGTIVWPFGQARDVLEHYAENAEHYSDEMYIGPGMGHLPDVGDFFAVDVVYNGDPATGERELAPLRAVGTPIVDGVTVQLYSFLQTVNDVPFRHGLRSYAKSGMVGRWTQGLVDTMIDAFNPRVFLSTHVAGGAVSRVGEAETAFPHRNAEIMLVFVSIWEDPALDDAMFTETRALHSALEPYMGGYYDNIDFDRDASTGNYGPAYARLSEIKGRYDPGNLFRMNSNIRPTI